MNEATEHNPDNLTPEIYGAPHWRLLRVGEVIEPQDQVFETGETGRKSGQWEYTVRPGMLPDRMTTYRRRVPTRQPEESDARREQVIGTPPNSVQKWLASLPKSKPTIHPSDFEGLICDECSAKDRRIADLLSLIEELSRALSAMKNWAQWQKDCPPFRLEMATAALARAAEVKKGDR